MARMNSPYINHFLSPDTVIPEQSQGIQAWDRYAYANNNPVRYSDPSGHMISQGCGDDGKGSCRADPNTHEESDNIQHLASLVQDVYENKCAAGNQAYCDGDPVEIAAFTLTMWTGGALAESFILGGGAASTLDVLGLAFSRTYDKVLYACLLNNTCSRFIGAGTGSVPDLTDQKLGHIFNNPEHNLDPLLAKFNGSQQAAYKAIYREFATVAESYSTRELADGIRVTVAGFIVVVSGKIVDGIARIGTAYIP